jgi:predicted PilT family ATPase
MNVDPSNDEGQKLLRSTQIQKQSPALFIALILLSLTALSFGAYTYQEQLLSLINSDETDEVKQSQAAIKKEDLIKKQIQGIQQTEVQKAADFKKVTKQKRKTEVKKKAKKKAKKIVKAKPKTQIQFFVDKDVNVFLDNRRIKNISKPVNVKSGKRKLRLEKPGFAPVETEIFAPVGELTKINARSGGAR